MPGYAFHLEVLASPALKDGLLKADIPREDIDLLDSEYAALGAFGPDLLMYQPPSATLAGDLADGTIKSLINDAADPLKAKSLTTDQWAEFEELYRNPLGSAYSMLFSDVVIPFWPDAVTFVTLFEQAQQIAQGQNTSALPGFFSSLSDLSGKLTHFQGSVNAIQDVTDFATIVRLGPWMEVAPAAALKNTATRADTAACRPYEYLRWHKAGQFATNLFALADSSGSQELKAYALGWLCHFAASVTAEPFVNNITGGPYRTHWWRNRLVQNYVDAWIWGFKQTSPQPVMHFDDPSVAYQLWSPLYGANLQQRFDVGNMNGFNTPVDTGAMAFPDAVWDMSAKQPVAGTPQSLATLTGTFPQELSSMLQTAIETTYSTDPQLTPPADLTGAAFASGYVGAYAVYWFLTAPEPGLGLATQLLGNDVPGAPPSASCGSTPPAWITKSGSSSPPPPGSGSVIQQSCSSVCEAILAALSLLFFLAGCAPAGVAALIGALEEAPSASINWSEVQCDTYWLLWWTDTVLATIQLGWETVSGEVVPATDNSKVPNPPTPAPWPTTLGPLPPRADATADPDEATITGVALTKANDGNPYQDPSGPVYPHRLDTAAIVADLDFMRYPQSAAETDTHGYTALDLLLSADDDGNGRYPDTVLDGLGGAIAGGIMGGGSPFPASETHNFGDAAGNAMQLIAAVYNDPSGAGVPDYNLDGDRGYGWLGWHPRAGTDPGIAPVFVVDDS